MDLNIKRFKIILLLVLTIINDLLNPSNEKKNARNLENIYFSFILFYFYLEENASNKNSKILEKEKFKGKFKGSLFLKCD